MPRFSIILPCFNAQDTIEQTLSGLIAQSFQDWEAICIDDGSTDATAELIKDIAKTDARIHLVRHAEKGPSAARNTGVSQHAHGDLIAFCDADDIWHPNKLLQLISVFDDPKIDGAFGQIAFFHNTPEDAHTWSTVPTAPLSINALLGENPVCTMSNLTLRKSAFLNCGGFNPEIVHNEDLEMLVRLVGRGAHILPVAKLQTYYRTTPDGLSANLDAMLKGREQALATAARFGVQPSRASHAIHHRYLARRALRLDRARSTALRHSLTGLLHSPAGFMSPARRGALTLGAALVATVLPRGIRRSLFC
ncbi:glycosyltransferase family 2 protein [Sulfitobacter sp. 1A10445]|uniref:glycosyltransferase family 2 protein n=1 Tax=unclassified Sulfitobacter TaxID=196795 RepID=UPI003745E91D